MTTTTDVGSVIKFGTDGWRAIIADEFTFDNVRICAQAVSQYLLDAKRTAKGVVVGYDTRFGSDRFAEAAAEVLTGNGIAIHFCTRPCPTPVVSFTILDRDAEFGVMITASHNPGEYNGFKIKDGNGASAPPEVVEAVEANIPAIGRGGAGAIKRMPIKEAEAKGLVKWVDPIPAYDVGVRRVLTDERLARIKNAGLTVIADSMYGAGGGYFRRLLRGGKTRVIELNGKPNPAFPGMHNPEPITQNLGKLMARVAQGASVGLATDGDADRLGVVDEHGNFMTQLQVYSLLCLYMLDARGERGPIVKSITTSSMVYRLGEKYDVPVVETNVGFKYVGAEMIRFNALIGGEESGGYGFRGHIPERDGVLAGLYFLDLMVSTGKTPAQLLDYLYSLVGPHYYDRIDMHFPAAQRPHILGLVTAAQKEISGVGVAKQETVGEGVIEGVRFMMADNSWLLVRFSGTEPLIRIYAESSSPQRTQQMLQAGKGIAGL